MRLTPILAAALTLAPGLALAGLNAHCKKLCRKEIALCIAHLNGEARGAKRACSKNIHGYCLVNVRQGKTESLCLAPPIGPPLGAPPTWQ